MLLIIFFHSLQHPSFRPPHLIIYKTLIHRLTNQNALFVIQLILKIYIFFLTNFLIFKK